MRRAARIAFIVPAAIAGVALFSWFVMLLWNHALAPATGWHEVTYWQALGRLVLAKILSGFGGGHSAGAWRSRPRRRGRENWESMKPQQRGKLRPATRAR